jgi:glutamate/aspartate transport system permease protein
MHWDWQIFLSDDGSGRTYLEWMLQSWAWTLGVACTAWCVAVGVGMGVGVMRTLRTPKWASRVAWVWVELFRNIPLLVQVFLWYFVLPKIFPVMHQFPSFWLVAVALGLFTSARIAEQMRAGIESIRSGQTQAALALGMTRPQVYRFVLMPLALRVILPPLTSESMNLLKNSSIAFAVSVPELTMFAMQAQEETSRGVEIYLAVTLLYACSAFAVNRLFAWVEARLGLPSSSAAKDTSAVATRPPHLGLGH